MKQQTLAMALVDPRALGRFRRNRGAVIGLVIVAFAVLVGQRPDPSETD